MAPSTLSLPAQKPRALKGGELIVYLDQEGERFIKASSIPSLGCDGLALLHGDVQDLLCSLKAQRDFLNKSYRRGETRDTRSIQKTKRWIKKAGSLNVLIEHEIHRRKKERAIAVAEAFVQNARAMLTTEKFDELLLAAITDAGQ